MASPRGAYAVSEDATWSPAKEARRKRYLSLVIREFLEHRGAFNQTDFTEIAAGMADAVLQTYLSVRKRVSAHVAHKPSASPVYDQHKIIAATQLAVMQSMPVRPDETRGYPGRAFWKEREKYKGLILLNAELAVYISIDIMRQWAGVDSKLFEKHSALRRGCCALLCEGDIPVFWSSMLWYAVEAVTPAAKPRKR